MVFTLQKLGAFTKLFLPTQTQKPKKVLKNVKVLKTLTFPLLMGVSRDFITKLQMLKSVKKHIKMLKYVKIKIIFTISPFLNPSIHRGLNHATPFKPALSQRL